MISKSLSFRGRNFFPDTNSIIALTTATEVETVETKKKKKKKKKMGSTEFLENVAKLLETREGIDKTLKIVKYLAIVLALSFNGESSSSTKRADDLGQTEIVFAKKMRKLSKSIGLSRGSLRLGKFLRFSLEARERFWKIWIDRRDDADDSSVVNDYDANANAVMFRFSLEFLAYFTEAAYYFIEQGVWLSNVGVFKANDQRELKVMAMKVEFLMYLSSIPLKVLELRDIIDEQERAYVAATIPSKEITSYRSFLAGVMTNLSPQKKTQIIERKKKKNEKDDDDGWLLEEEEEEEEFDELRFKRSNATKSIIKDVMDLILVTADLEWIRDKRVSDLISNEWVYSSLSLSSAMISISKLWLKTLRV